MAYNHFLISKWIFSFWRPPEEHTRYAELKKVQGYILKSLFYQCLSTNSRLTIVPNSQRVWQNLLKEYIGKLQLIFESPSEFKTVWHEYSLTLLQKEIHKTNRKDKGQYGQYLSFHITTIHKFVIVSDMAGTQTYSAMSSIYCWKMMLQQQQSKKSQVFMLWARGKNRAGNSEKCKLKCFE